MKILKSWWHTRTQILSLFEHDLDSVPELFLTDPAGNAPLKSSFAPKNIFASHTCYYEEDDKIVFVLNEQNHPNINLNCENYYLCGNFNGWLDALGKPEWNLKCGRDKKEFILAVDKKNLFDGKRKLFFKFAKDFGQWVEPMSDALNIDHDNTGNANLSIARNKTGKNLILSECLNEQDINVDISICSPKHETCAPVNARDLFLSLKSDDSLGVQIQHGYTRFSIFAPRALRVQVLIQEALDSEIISYDLMSAENGIWKTFIKADLSDKLYSYRISGKNSDNTTAFDSSVKIADPYAFALHKHTGPALIIDKKNLPVAKNFKTPKWHDLSIMEVHLRDVLANANIEDSQKHTFKGLENWLKQEECYLKKSGINCIELQPIQEFDNLTYSEYHWGYMPVNWFSPSSAYASEPNKFSQITEFASLINTFHESNFAVILDVVYNHVGEPNHLLRVDKFYYFETAHDFSLMNYSGCGNDFRANAPMSERMIIDSLKHLVVHYGVDGFRFDLAELLGVATLRKIEKELKALKPDIILIAEPWSFRGHIAQALSETGFSSWNDGFREYAKKYVLNQGDKSGFKYFVSGSRQHFANWPAQTVNYIESHDDKCFLDNITDNFESPSLIDLKRYKLAYAFLFMSIGIPMAAEGFDFARTKSGKNNTYKDGDENALKYSRIYSHTNLCRWMRNLAKFRNSKLGEALRLADPVNDSYFRFFENDSNAICVLFNADNSSKAKQILATFNPTSQTQAIYLNAFNISEFTHIADIENFDTAGLDDIAMEKSAIIKLPPYSFSLWVKNS